jgi:hypothetical protein
VISLISYFACKGSISTLLARGAFHFLKPKNETTPQGSLWEKPFGKSIAHSLRTAFTQWPTAPQQHGCHRASARDFPPAQPELSNLVSILGPKKCGGNDASLSFQPKTVHYTLLPTLGHLFKQASPHAQRVSAK